MQPQRTYACDLAASVRPLRIASVAWPPARAWRAAPRPNGARARRVDAATAHSEWAPAVARGHGAAPAHALRCGSGAGTRPRRGRGLGEAPTRIPRRGYRGDACARPPHAECRRRGLRRVPRMWTHHCHLSLLSCFASVENQSLSIAIARQNYLKKKNMLMLTEWIRFFF